MNPNNPNYNHECGPPCRASDTREPTRLAILLTILGCVGNGLGVYAQGSFQNLNFEAANVSGYSPGNVIPVGRALPGWSVDFSPGFGQVWYDGISLGGAMISVCDSNTPGLGRSATLQGRYSAILFGGAFGPSTISQTGLVPSTARSLQMYVGNISSTMFTVSLGGIQLNMVTLATYPAYTLYGGDISSLAGQIASLNLTTPLPGLHPPSWFQVDSIVFSPQVVPEPAPFALWACGLLILGLRFLMRWLHLGSLKRG